ncbi:hypothetical protein ARMGADRAFT_434635 [Armillaria gallica]|uniref:Uncharacterized protein n=1 Tax=Armillaria gallica TaxID=47427 RepID=A0A2H3DIW5_ARMGA|nr:hypothetical protein ARMGADRAFT_434635 [Armillaria gallica]
MTWIPDQEGNVTGPRVFPPRDAVCVFPRDGFCSSLHSAIGVRLASFSARRGTPSRRARSRIYQRSMWLSFRTIVYILAMLALPNDYVLAGLSMCEDTQHVFQPQVSLVPDLALRDQARG